jgi:hypothetical protein
MTPDEFDQKRRELITMRTKYAGRDEVTNRINNLIGQLEQAARTTPGSQRDRLDQMIERTITELGKLTYQ